MNQAVQSCCKTWRNKDGVLMVDYSSRNMAGASRKHADLIDLENFNWFLFETEPFDFDVMLEIKDKEKSAIKALEAAKNDPRLKKV